MSGHREITNDRRGTLWKLDANALRSSGIDVPGKTSGLSTGVVRKFFKELDCIGTSYPPTVRVERWFGKGARVTVGPSLTTFLVPVKSDPET